MRDDIGGTGGASDMRRALKSALKIDCPECGVGGRGGEVSTTALKDCALGMVTTRRR